MGIDLKVAQLRKLKGVSQQELADYLRVTFQTVSKWETKTALPGITLLPEIAKYFQVTVDEVLGLVPINGVSYEPRATDDREQWKDREQMIDNNRQFFWNEDYLVYLVREVWKINEPVNLIEFCCCDGSFGKSLMKILPEGSTYTGVDSEYLVNKAKINFQSENYKTNFIVSDIYSFQTKKYYDLSICQASLRHMNQPLKVLEIMKGVVKQDGLVACVEIDREIENVGLYVDGIDYHRICASFDMRKLWLSELKNEGRDYAVGIRAPFYMRQIGLVDVDSRMNDKITYITPSHSDYSKKRDAFITIHGWDDVDKSEISDSKVDFFMSRGYSREEIENLYDFQREMAEYVQKNWDTLSFLQIYGFIISYGRKMEK